MSKAYSDFNFTIWVSWPCQRIPAKNDQIVKLSVGFQKDYFILLKNKAQLYDLVVFGWNPLAGPRDPNRKVEIAVCFGHHWPDVVLFTIQTGQNTYMKCKLLFANSLAGPRNPNRKVENAVCLGHRARGMLAFTIQNTKNTNTPKS